MAFTPANMGTISADMRTAMDSTATTDQLLRIAQHSADEGAKRKAFTRLEARAKFVDNAK